jgi:hypothetical protein
VKGELRAPGAANAYPMAGGAGGGPLRYARGRRRVKDLPLDRLVVQSLFPPRDFWVTFL